MGRMMLTEATNGFDSFLEVNGFAERLVVYSMSDDWPIAIIMYVNLYAFDTLFEVLHVSLYLWIAGELIAWEIGVVRRVAEIVSKRKWFIDRLRESHVIAALAHKVAAEIIKTDLLSSLL